MTLAYINDDDFDAYNAENNEQIDAWNSDIYIKDSVLYNVLTNIDVITIQNVQDYTGWSYEGCRSLVSQLLTLEELFEHDPYSVE